MNHYIVPCNLYNITQQLYLNKSILEGFPGGPVVKNLPHNAGDGGSIPDWGTKIPHASEQLITHHITTRESVHHSKRSRMTQGGP